MSPPKKQTSHTPSKRIDQGYLNALANAVCDHIDDILARFNISDYSINKTGRLTMHCPIHGGDNKYAVNVYLNGDARGYWKCRTNQCHEKYKSTIIGFVRGLLSTRYEREVSFKESVDFLSKLIDSNELKFETISPVKNDFNRLVNNFVRQPTPSDKIETRAQFRRNLNIPASYYLDRGYPENLLDQYDIGTYKFFNCDRVIIPVYDFSYTRVMGALQRSIYEKCYICNMYHSEHVGCPPSFDKNMSFKWRNHGFDASKFLFNLWFAKKKILENKTCILVEGAGDVLRLEQAGIHNSVSTFGASNFSEDQQILLEKTGAENLIIAMDSDEAGQIARDNIINATQHLYNIRVLNLDNKDFGEMSTKEIQCLF